MLDLRDLREARTAILTCDESGTIYEANAAALAFFDCNQEKLMGVCIDELVSLSSGHSTQEHLALVAEAMSHNAQGKSIVCRLVGSDKKAELVVWGVPGKDKLNQASDSFICHLNLINEDGPDQRTVAPRSLIEIVDELQQNFIADRGAYHVFGRALDALLQYTESEYGFIGEILKKNDGEPYLQTHAISNIAWSEDTKTFFEHNAPSGLAFFNNKTLFGHTVLTGEVVIANEPDAHPKSNGRPEGHPLLRHYLGVPIFCSDELIGMAGIANKQGGYDESLVEDLRMLMNTLGFLIKAYQNEKHRKFVEAKLLLQARQLDDANQAKSKFLASMSHELRTPLNSIIGFSSLLLPKVETNKETKEGKRTFEAVDAIHRNGQHLLAIITDLLDLAKLEAGKIAIDLKPLDLNELLIALGKQVQSLLTQHGVDLQIQCPDHASLLADELRLRQILLNLISNAVKFGKGEAKISVERTGWVDEAQEIQGWKIDVWDNGDPISTEEIAQLFKPYTQMKNVKQQEGTGLGLAISAEYAKLHQGSISIQSDETGTTASLLLPDLLG